MESLQPFQQRVVTERDELQERFRKLREFIDSQAFSVIPEKDRELLREQAIEMFAYCEILRQRIERFALPQDEMFVFLRPCAPTDDDPMAQRCPTELVAATVPWVTEHGIPALPRGSAQNIQRCLRRDLLGDFPGVIVL